MDRQKTYLTRFRFRFDIGTSNVLTKTGTQLEPPGTGRNQLELAENHLEPPVYISGISWNHQTRVTNQLLSWNQQWFHILRYLNFCKTKM